MKYTILNVHPAPNNFSRFADLKNLFQSKFQPNKSSITPFKVPPPNGKYMGGCLEEIAPFHPSTK
jgi:hypothetical protein